MDVYFVTPSGQTPFPWLDLLLFLTQALVVIAAFAAPHLAHRKALMREQLSHKLATEREETAHKNAQLRSEAERTAVAEALFSAIAFEASLLRERIGRLQNVWNTPISFAQAQKYTRLEMPPILSNASFWSSSSSPKHIRAVINLWRHIAEYEEEAEEVRGNSSANIPDHRRAYFIAQLERINDICFAISEMEKYAASKAEP